MERKTSQLTVNAMLAAICAVLGYISIELGNLKITFEGIPVIMAALMYGPASGTAVGGVGVLIYQLLRYGITATTPLWILPYMAVGLAAGLYAKKYNFSNSNGQILFIITASELLIFLINTFALYVDSHVYGYYSPQFILGSLGIRFVICIGKSVVFGLIMPNILKKLSKITHNGSPRTE